MKAPVRKIRCAIYTRKSTEEGLDMAFNSLDAQRESCEAFIASQRSEGWLRVPDRYDDGGFSGGSMKRPALQRLLQDIDGGLVDCVVVYKIDRLSRSLVDFTKMVELFDRQEVTFVSITQSFNTTTSMGRLTLNILLSFAQFEREVASERIRDKFAASRKKGIWMGGPPPLGYDVKDRRLVINPEEADLIRLIFDRFASLGSATQVCRTLVADGYRTKSWVSGTGRRHEGKPFDKNGIYRALGNRLYLGDVVYKGEIYAGEHQPILTLHQWEKVQSVLRKDRHKRSARSRAQSPFPLKGIIQCGHCNRAMTTTHTRKRGRLYRYYLCVTAAKQGYDTCPISNIAAGEIEEMVLNHIEAVVRSPELIARTWRQANDGVNRDHSQDAIIQTLRSIEPVWEALFPAEQARLTQLLVRHVILTQERIRIHLRVEGLNSLVDTLGNQEAA